MKKIDLQKEIERYIETKKGSWSESTLRSERYRLRGVTLEQLADPAALYEYLAKERELKPYPLKTAFVRAGEVVEFLQRKGLLPAGRNVVKDYMEEHANLFKHAYTKKEVSLSFEEADQLLEKLPDALQEKARQLLYTGMRYTESTTLEDGVVKGKGGWHREVPLAQDLPAEDYDASYTTLYRALKKLGLTPHMLRKLCATKLAREGAQEADLMKRMGWRSSAMAAKYVQAERVRQLDEQLRNQLKKRSKKDGK